MPDAEPFNYERAQFDRLLNGEMSADGRYLVKVGTSDTNSATKWLTASRDQVERIAAIMAENCGKEMTCGKPMHKNCKCIRYPNHPNECNCSYRN